MLSFMILEYKLKIIICWEDTQGRAELLHITLFLRRGLLGRVFRDYTPTPSHWVQAPPRVYFSGSSSKTSQTRNVSRNIYP